MAALATCVFTGVRKRAKYLVRRILYLYIRVYLLNDQIMIMMDVPSLFFLIDAWVSNGEHKELIEKKYACIGNNLAAFQAAHYPNTQTHPVSQSFGRICPRQISCTQERRPTSYPSVIVSFCLVRCQFASSIRYSVFILCIKPSTKLLVYARR